MRRFTFRIGNVVWRFLGRKGKIKFFDATTQRSVSRDGCCDLSGTKNPAIRINLDADPDWLLELVLHEYTHAGLPYLDEQVVTDFAKGATEMLTKLGYTRTIQTPRQAG